MRQFVFILPKITDLNPKKGTSEILLIINLLRIREYSERKSLKLV